MGEFHIHIDATKVSGPFEEYLLAAGFTRSDFAGHPDGEKGYEAPHHLTLKLSDSAEFRTRFEDVVEFAKNGPAMCGYIEGEFIPLDKDMAERPYQASARAPFSVVTGPLPPGEFRETEVHITMDRDRSDPRLLESLSNMGFFSAFMQKSYGVAQIFTVQGSRFHIDQILPPLLHFLETNGGAAHCSVKEERIAKWWLSDASVALPPVIASIEWESAAQSH